MSDMGDEELLRENTLLIEVLDPRAAWAGLDGDTHPLEVLEATPTARAPGHIPITVAGLEKAWAAVVETVADHLDGRRGLRVLELAAGARPLLRLPADAHVVGVGRDGEALERNLRLDERVVARVEDYRPRAWFDLVLGWYALDDLRRPAPVVDRIARWLAPGGLVVLAVANPHSPAAVRARLRGWPRPRRAAWPDALRHRLVHRGLTPLLQVYFADSPHAPARRLLARLATLGTLDPAQEDFAAVFHRPNLT